MQVDKNNELEVIYEHYYSQVENVKELWEEPQYYQHSQNNTFYYDKINNQILLVRTENTCLDHTDVETIKKTTTTYEFDQSVTLQYVVTLCCMQDQGANVPIKCFETLLKKSARIRSQDTE